MMLLNRFCIALFFMAVSLCGANLVVAQHEHDGGGATVKVPKIFLDKSPRIVEYQLKRLSNEQLLAVETKTDDKKYLPVLNAILTREGMSRAYREEALEGMIAINGSNAVDELSVAIKSINGDSASARRTVDALAKLLLAQPDATLAGAAEELSSLARDDSGLTAAVGFAGLVASGRTDEAFSMAKELKSQASLLDGLRLIPSDQVRSGLHERVVAMLTAKDSVQVSVRQAALRALSVIPSNQDRSFELASRFLQDDELRREAVRTMLNVPAEARDAVLSQSTIEWLVEFAERTPKEQRTESSFLDAMQLVDQLLAKAPSDFAKTYRSRLNETVVRVVRIHTIEEEMRYDIPYFAVEAGRPVQVVLINDDLMPHNLVITKPGALKEVADLGMETGPTGGLDGKQYVPQSDLVLFATNMIPTLAEERLTFDAPSEPGEYPYVCTFPRHWMRMYGVMVVVEDLDAWLKNPTEPTDPIGSNRSFVQSWTVDDFQGDLTQSLRGRSKEIGERIFTEATCAQCHKAGDIGVGNVGPPLAETFAKYKGDPAAVLQEILDPSHRIDDKYAVHLILDVNDQTFSGLVISEDKEKVTLLENPEAKEPTVILQDDIEQMVKTSNSMMPKGLMDRFSKDEIFELLSFIQSVQKE